MAEAFAAGNWLDAFHPRFAVGGTCISGLAVLIFGLDGYSACSATSMFAWGLCTLPIFYITRRLFDDRAALFAVAFYLLCPMPMTWALKGLREPYKVLGLLLAADAILRCRSSEKNASIEAIFAIVLLAIFKCDAIILGFMAALAFLVASRFSARGWIVLGAKFLALQPMCFLVWQWTDWWLPAPHYVTLLKKLFGG